MPKRNKPKPKPIKYIVICKGRQQFQANPEEEYTWEGPAARSFREWVTQGKMDGSVEYVQLWELFDGVEDPVLRKEKIW